MKKAAKPRRLRRDVDPLAALSLQSSVATRAARASEDPQAEASAARESTDDPTPREDEAKGCEGRCRGQRSRCA